MPLGAGRTLAVAYLLEPFSKLFNDFFHWGFMADGEWLEKVMQLFVLIFGLEATVWMVWRMSLFFLLSPSGLFLHCQKKKSICSMEEVWLRPAGLIKSHW